MLVVSQLPFFDHSSLHALRLHTDTKPSTGAVTSQSFSPRLLIAAQCHNATSSGLAEALLHLPNLVFLDLSNTTAARDKQVLANLRCMSNLQVLKLRQVNLRDQDVEILADAVKVCIRSLDVRGNLLTDGSITTLRRLCFIAPGVNDGLTGSRISFMTGAGLEDWPSGIARNDPDLLDDFRHEALDEHFMKQLARSNVGRLPSEDLPRSGITHLYISDNRLTAEGLLELIESKRLFVLDAGAVDMGKALKRPQPPSLPGLEGPMYLAGLNMITHAIETCCFQNLTSLRIHHAVVTRKTLFSGKSSSSLPPPFSYELGAEDARYELDAAQPVFELAVDQPEARHELPGDSVHLVVGPAVGQKPSLSAQENMPSPRGGGAFAPEVVEEVDSDEQLFPVLTPTGLGPMAQAVNGVGSEDEGLLSPVESQSMGINGGTVELRVSLIGKQRQQLRSHQPGKLYSLSPGMLPELRTLTLTDVPCNDPEHHVVDALIEFIADCASETDLAELEASLIQPDKATDSSRRRDSVHFRNGGRHIFALSRIVLEMAPPASSLEPASNPFRTVQASRLPYRTKSSTEDADSEALWSAQVNDFSFFGDEEECGLPATEPGLRVPLSMISEEKMTVGTEGTGSDGRPSARKPKKLDLGPDVVQELARFRKLRKEAYGEAVKRGERTVEGYWPGEVKIVNWHARQPPKHGKTDYYGNHSERGIYR